ncbi:NAD-dependent epimerase/dehydratase family protein [Arthrobacter sp. TWP1-1]|uniref:NAD-dependent epimerase/dehydratase family protein n=1 Tax=Arthrobacter sp. TWP1-1 TaxID=2804568 RepID=UPI003CEF452D
MSVDSANLRWLVLGASGFVGSAIAAELRARDANVVTMSAPRLDSSATTADAIVAAAHSPLISSVREELCRAFTDIDVVINAAGLATPSDGESQALTGANALLPAVAALAAHDAGVGRVVHLSSASVQGHRRVIDESAERSPFSAYSRSKALGEEALELLLSSTAPTSVVTVRATSVQGISRPTTLSLIKVAGSPIASVAAPGTAPTPVSSIDALAWFVVQTGQHAGDVPAVVLQPWEGLSVSDVLTAAGGHAPRRLPRWLCRSVLATGYFTSRLLGERLHGPIRRVELMWFGQEQAPGWAEAVGLVPVPSAAALLEKAHQAH